ncbi:MAG: dTDP-4-dehydrorhamnose reductase [Muribaculaceae bacterium]|nr:dTDP-4-dehydrorhamnose reductase [Muribaculaceae bacterium]
MKKVLVTGGNGQLGNCLREVLERETGIEAVFTDVAELDITNPEAVDKFVGDLRPDYIVNCAAYTAVDKAESEDSQAARLNTEAVGNIAKAAARHNARVIHISTDYVFAGDSHRPYAENDEPYPQSIYGRTKLEGEGVLKAFCPDCIIIRTAWLYSEYGGNFVKTMLRIGGATKSIRVVSDQIGTPTYAGDLAECIRTIILKDNPSAGIYHFTNEGVASWYDFAKAIFRLSGMEEEVEVTPIGSEEYPTPARRPLYSVLNKRKIKETFNINIPYWENSLKKCLKQMK